MFPINYLKKNFKNFMIRKSLSCKMFDIAQFAKVYTKIWIAPPPRESFSNESNLKIGKIDSVKIHALDVSDFVPKFHKKSMKLPSATVKVFITPL